MSSDDSIVIQEARPLSGATCRCAGTCNGCRKKTAVEQRIGDLENRTGVIFDYFLDHVWNDESKVVATGAAATVEGRVAVLEEMYKHMFNHLRGELVRAKTLTNGLAAALGQPPVIKTKSVRRKLHE